MQTKHVINNILCFYLYVTSITYLRFFYGKLHSKLDFMRFHNLFIHGFLIHFFSNSWNKQSGTWQNLNVLLIFLFIVV